MRAFRVSQINGDGTSAEDQTFPFYPDLDATGKPYLDEQGVPCVSLTLRTITKARYRDWLKLHTSHLPDGSGVLRESVDVDAVRIEAVRYAVVGWHGFVGADDQPLVCDARTKAALDTMLQNAIVSKAMYAQPVEVTAASFREPAGLPALVGGSREDGAVLSAGQA